MGGHTRFCPACKSGQYHTVKEVKDLTILTCRGCGYVAKIRGLR